MINYERIQTECFWDFNFTNEELEAIAKGKNQAEKKFLFEKILLNSTKFLVDLTIFSLEDLKHLLQQYQISQFNSHFAFRRKNMAEFFFFDQELLVKELQWEE